LQIFDRRPSPSILPVKESHTSTTALNGVKFIEYCNYPINSVG